MFLHSQGELALGSRFKAVSESLYAAANEAYRASGVDIDAHWFPVLRYLQVKGPATVTEIATAIRGAGCSSCRRKPSAGSIVSGPCGARSVAPRERPHCAGRAR